MEEDFVTFEIAKKLKEKGFPQNICDYGYIMEEDNYDYFDIGDRESIWMIPDYLSYISAPTIGQALKWIRETKKIYIVSAYMPKIMHETGISNDFYYPTFQKIGLFEPMFFIGGDDDYDTYEKSILAGIEFILDKWENIKT